MLRPALAQGIDQPRSQHRATGRGRSHGRVHPCAEPARRGSSAPRDACGRIASHGFVCRPQIFLRARNDRNSPARRPGAASQPSQSDAEAFPCPLSAGSCLYLSKLVVRPGKCVGLAAAACCSCDLGRGGPDIMRNYAAGALRSAPSAPLPGNGSCTCRAI